jgi:hypothetical protein
MFTIHSGHFVINECKVCASGNKVHYQFAFERLRVFGSGESQLTSINTWEIFPHEGLPLLAESGIFNDERAGFRRDLIFHGKVA